MGIARRGLLCGLGALAAGRAAAEGRFPGHPLRILVPFAPGGSVDIISRLLAEGMRPALGQTVIVENRPGGNGVVGLEALARSRPDGYTMLVGNVTTNGLMPLLTPERLSFDFNRDLMPLARLADVASVLVATTVGFPADTLAQAIELARRDPGRVNYITTGPGSYVHFDTVLLQRAAGVRLTHVPVSAGAGAYFQALAKGDVHLGFMNAASATPLVQSGQLRGLAVAGETRLAELPDVPTMREAGFPGIGTPAWHTMLLPAGTPAEVVNALFGAVRAATQSPAVRDAYRRQSITATLSASPADARTWQDAELARWRGIIADTRSDMVE